MNITFHTMSTRKPLIVAAVAAVLLAACASVPVKPDGAAQARAMLTQLQADPNLASRAPLSMQQAEAAVRLAETPETDQQLVAYRVYMADRKVETARAVAETKFAEDQRAGLTAQRDQARLDARTREADIATDQAAAARAEGAEQKAQADAARTEGAEQKAQADAARNQAEAVQTQADAAQSAAQAAALNAQNAAQAAALNAQNAAQAAALNAQQQADELQRQIDTLQARTTDRGLVLTLGDVLFATNRAELIAGANGHLNKLVAFLNKYPDRTVNIEGYTDSTGGADYNLGLSQRRAESVRSYLIDQGIESGRLIASGKGMSSPVAGNDTATGRQQNRRVEVVINDPVAAKL
ncbi:MAG TPA: OmpA family protein [Steroidobacteraceae bacterium]